ncbi:MULTISPECIES: HAD family hydrolase [unclassified Bradyrhizobium]|uniref:HAD family hydrolase n=1 Tax=unclassified Bradyrhizobium TaxID=2631580 RepID=UPI00247A843F|nr:MULTISPECIES: HAD family hydrolase [unclassified Bradyrhizobium]WGR69504.1 HAD family hydrolase [Bradyrhizobium sp. ISRA426]WGR81560.1 HAD family hydrolase [Bradyrhizobium sp. ISRA430]WGR84744.1 HAD family hydrolase [Bradyrhizobium sp. ISRA432]
MTAMKPLPRAMLIDMDDTILSAYGRPEIAWNTIATEFAEELAPLPPQQVATAVLSFARNFWANAEAAWRLKLGEARRLTVKGGFAALAAAGHRALPDDLAIRLADRFTAYREDEMFVFPGAHDAIDRLKALGIKLALVTNGAADMQRAKVERFELAHRFHHIQIEGEHGFGKPEERAYLHAMDALGVTAKDTWMIGDNLEWEVVTPQRLGIYAVWMDVHGDGLPEGSTVKPDRIIRSLTELVPDRV